MAGEELFSTDVNSQNTGYDQNNPVAGNIVGNSASTNPLDSDALKLLTTYLSQTNVPQASTTLPPQYYYPGQQGVAIGQMSGPMGSLTTYSPGQALFPMSVLDAVEKENKAMRQKAIDEMFKPLDEKYFTLKNPRWNNEFSKYQMDRYSSVENEYIEKAGGDVRLARKMMERDGILEKTAFELQWIKDGHDKTYDAVLDIQAAYKDKTRYVDPKSVELSNRYLALNAAPGDFKDKYDELMEIQNELWSGISMDEAGKEIRDAVAAEIFQDKVYTIMQYGEYDENGNLTNEKQLRDMINTHFQQAQYKGIYLYQNNPEKMADLRERLGRTWDEKYGSDPRAKDRIKRDDFIQNQIDKMTGEMTYNALSQKDTDAYIQAAANYQYEFRPIDEVSGVTSDVPTTEGLKTKEINVLGLSSGLTGNSFTGLNARIWDANKGKWVNKNINGSINSRISYNDKIGVDKQTGKPIYGKVYQYVINVETGQDADGNKQYQQVIASSNTSIDGAFQETLIKNKMRVGKEGSGYIQTETPDGGTFSSKTTKPKAYTPSN